MEKIKPYLLPITCVLLLCGMIYFLIKDIIHSGEVALNLVIPMKQLPDNIARSESRYVTREELEGHIKQRGLNLDAIQDDLDALHARLLGLSSITVSTPGFHGVALPSTSTSPNPNPPPISTSCPNIDPYGYQRNAQTLTLNEPIGSQYVPFGSTTFRSWEPQPWEEIIYPRDYSVNSVISTNEDGQHVVQSQVSINTQGKKYDLPIAKATFEEVPAERHWMFNPRLFLGINLGATVVNVTGVSAPAFEFSPGIDVSFFSYGKTKKDIDLALLNVGVNYDTQAEAPSFSISPLYYNVGQHLPLMNNLFVGPEATINTNGDIGVMGTIKVGL